MYKFKHNDFVYQYPDLPFIVHNKETPESLYKYYAFNEFSVEALLNQYLFAAHPFDLNDIFDSSFHLWFSSEKLTYDKYKFLFNGSKTEAQIKEFYKNDDHSRDLINQIWKIFSNWFGIISLSEEENNKLMWPHYTKEIGFQVKFNTANLISSIKQFLPNKENFIGISPINYCDNLKRIDQKKINNYIVPLHYITNIKSKEWDYENEWRIIISNGTMGIPFSKVQFENREDIPTQNSVRNAKYENAIEQITIANNFFNARNFIINRDSESVIMVKPDVKNDKNDFTKLITSFLDFICKNFKDKLFITSVEESRNEAHERIIKRSKLKMEIEKKENGFYELTVNQTIIDL